MVQNHNFPKKTAVVAKPQSVGAKKRKRTRKTHRDPSYKAKRSKTDSTEKMETDGESVAESTEDETEEEEDGEEDGEEITDGDEEGESEEIEGGGEEAEGDKIKDGEEGDGEVEDGNQDEDPNRDGEESEERDREKVVEEEGNNVEGNIIDQKRNKDDKSKEGESLSQPDKKGAKYLDVNKVVEALEKFESKEIRKRIELFGAFKKELTRILTSKAGYPYLKVPDGPDKAAFISAADKWSEEEGIVAVTPVFKCHKKVGRRLKDLAEGFSEAILLLNYEDEDLQFLSKSAIEKINTDDWQALTAALSKLKESSPPAWIHCKLPTYARYILGLQALGPVIDARGSAVEPRTPTQSRNNTDKNHLPSPAPTPQKSKTATQHHPNAIEIFGSDKELYSDDCFFNERRESVEKNRCLAVTEVIREFVAPVNRDKNHWVAYAGAQNANGTWSWGFADSMGGDTRRYEINDIRRLLKIPAPDLASIEKKVNIPQQTDKHNCGPFALEWLLKFLDNDTGSVEKNLLEIRKRHLQMLNDALECEEDIGRLGISGDSTSEKDLEGAAEDLVIVNVESKTTAERRLFEEEEDDDDDDDDDEGKRSRKRAKVDTKAVVLPGNSAVARNGDEKRERSEGTGSVTEGSALLVPQETDLNGQTEGSHVEQRNKRSIEKVDGRVDEDHHENQKFVPDEKYKAYFKFLDDLEDPDCNGYLHLKRIGKIDDALVKKCDDKRAKAKEKLDEFFDEQLMTKKFLKKELAEAMRKERNERLLSERDEI
ncbi:hypothetical protein HK104_003685 [Borealophlyctis nickersoniae]|nr:hypothetical protein HK104_003685 [Borealophlyctis nickersoniae]